MTHQQIQDNEVIEQYVLQKLSPDARRAFQEHYFECDECFEQTNVAARFIAGVREASRSGVLAAKQTERLHFWSRLMPPVLNQGWTRAWAMPALAMGLILAVVLTGLWAVSLRRENRLLAKRTTERSDEQGRESERLRTLEAKIRELEANNSASQEQKESLSQELGRLKEQLAATERQRETHVAQLRQPEVNAPVRNIYPVGDAQRSGGTGEVNQLRVPRGTRAFVLILGDHTPGYSNYRLEIRDPSGRIVTRRAGLKPDQNGELSVLLNRALLSQGKYTLKLYGEGKAIAEYVVELRQ